MNNLFFDSPAFQDACRQLDRAADKLNLEDVIRERLRFPQRILVVSCPIRMDSGEIKTFIGYRVQHSLTLGPGKGGIRYHPGVELGEIIALAMNMSWKSGLAELPFGGAKGGIAVDPHKLSKGELERLTRRYTVAIIPIIGPNSDIPAPDMGTDSQIMAWIMDTYSIRKGFSVPAVVTGKPVCIGGSLGREEATGYGVAYITETILKQYETMPADTRVVIQGFGNVGMHSALKLDEMGCRIIALSDANGGLYSAAGLPIKKLAEMQRNGDSIHDYQDADSISNEELLTLPCDILIPAAIGRVITKENAHRVSADIIIEGANSPVTVEADDILTERNVLLVPDILANAGGLIVSYFEWVQGLQEYYWSKEMVFTELKRRLQHNFIKTYTFANSQHVSLRMAALMLGIQSVAEAKKIRGLYP